MKILAIETSCDETAAAVIEKNGKNIRILSNVVSSQIEIHQKFGGVFPEYASRAHAEKIISVVEQALACEKNTLKRGLQENFDVIAVTTGPGLIGSLLVGVNFAKTYAYATGKPIIGINHWLGHIYSNFVGEECKNQKSKCKMKMQNEKLPEFPALILIASGGHTGLVLMKSHTNIRTLGETLDDAAGEAFDKVAKLLELGYPGGPAIAAEAEKFRKVEAISLNEMPVEEHSDLPRPGNEAKSEATSRLARAAESEEISRDLNISFPRSMLDRKDYHFSFSGLKTAVLYKVKELQSQGITTNHYKSLVAHEFQQTVIDILIGKTIQAAYEFRPKSVCLCGGVSANKNLREQMSQTIQQFNKSTNQQIFFHTAPMALTTDNAAMVAIAAAYQIANGQPTTDYRQINADANEKLS